MLLDPTFATTLGREAAEARMVDACRVTVPGSGPTGIDEDTGKPTPPAPDVLYVGACEIQLPDTTQRDANAGAGDFSVQSVTVKLPVEGTGTIPVGARVEITACALDPSIVGVDYVVRGLHRKSFATARRLRCEEANR